MDFPWQSFLLVRWLWLGWSSEPWRSTIHCGVWRHACASDAESNLLWERRWVVWHHNIMTFQKLSCIVQLRNGWFCFILTIKKEDSEWQHVFWETLIDIYTCTQSSDFWSRQQTRHNRGHFTWVLFYFSRSFCGLWISNKTSFLSSLPVPIENWVAAMMLQDWFIGPRSCWGRSREGAVIPWYQS